MSSSVVRQGKDDLTLPFGWNPETDYLVPEPPKLGPPRNQTVLDLLKTGPQHFRDLMEGTGSRDGRDIIIELDKIRNDVGFERLEDGRYALSEHTTES